MALAAWYFCHSGFFFLNGGVHFMLKKEMYAFFFFFFYYALRTHAACQRAKKKKHRPFAVAPALSAGPHGGIKGMPNSSLKVSVFHMALLCLACYSLVRGAGRGEFLLCIGCGV